MPITRVLVMPILAAGAAAAVALAPTAAATAPQPNCTYTGHGNSVCQSPGNAQVVAAPPQVPYQPWGYYPYGGNLIILGGHPSHGR